ncbi:prepilin-type N-terminal cleavage/methylation domain-containing protein [Synechocystis sp. PCC 7339]|uniref:pilus assembly FimT family protein n=1 Tax=unclassified Synechocystis TaxID=2640012 RepID=UPI001BB089B8|nr:MULTISPECIES: prepilin-type N-terminal cleavage/methylation domain-containing protein [unclassified Synechocystis]QUS60147.1 prepilin-type N-terminal cleavage/methylation domain-containing protein [Synechocystis sp. PCC 7338]UAJ72406.1 prepilin-type N-terminal cleavage/methylation domain-containing protein [Synechocystis sp. PCC 7339]
MMTRSYGARLPLKILCNSPARVAHRGWTLIEVVVVAVIVSILASLALPSFGKMQARNQLRSAMAEVQGAIQEAQRNAIKRGSSCTVVINPSTRTVNQASLGSTGCVPSPVTIKTNTGISFTQPSTTTTITFSYKGNPSSTNITAGNDDVIVLRHEITSLEPRCLVVSSGIGIMRSGYYQGSTCTPAP